MDDQVSTLKGVGIPAEYIGAGVRVDQALALIRADKLRVLYITPEMCSRVPEFFSQIRECMPINNGSNGSIDQWAG